MKSIVNLTSDMTTPEMKRNVVESLEGMYLDGALRAEGVEVLYV